MWWELSEVAAVRAGQSVSPLSSVPGGVGAHTRS